MTVRAKSIVNKNRRLLAESIVYQKRVDIMSNPINALQRPQ